MIYFRYEKDMNRGAAVTKRKLQYLITTTTDEIKPQVKEWLDNQSNRSQSVLFLIEQIVKRYGTGDLVSQILDEVDITSSIGTDTNHEQKGGTNDGETNQTN